MFYEKCSMKMVVENCCKTRHDVMTYKFHPDCEVFLLLVRQITEPFHGPVFRAIIGHPHHPLPNPDRGIAVVGQGAGTGGRRLGQSRAQPLSALGNALAITDFVYRKKHGRVGRTSEESLLPENSVARSLSLVFLKME